MDNDSRIHHELCEYDFEANCEEAAEARGCIVVYPASNQLQLDIDTEEQFVQFQRRFAELGSMTGYFWQLPMVSVSQSGLPCRHITLTTIDHEFDEWERFALQFLLGSDPVRETLNVYRMIRGVENPTRLFEPKEKE